MNTTTKNPPAYKINLAGRSVTVWPQSDGTKTYELRATDRLPVLIERDEVGRWIMPMTGKMVVAMRNADGTIQITEGISIPGKVWYALNSL